MTLLACLGLGLLVTGIVYLGVLTAQVYATTIPTSQRAERIITWLVERELPRPPYDPADGPPDSPPSQDNPFCDEDWRLYIHEGGPDDQHSARYKEAKRARGLK